VATPLEAVVVLLLVAVLELVGDVVVLDDGIVDELAPVGTVLEDELAAGAELVVGVDVELGWRAFSFARAVPMLSASAIAPVAVASFVILVMLRSPVFSGIAATRPAPALPWCVLATNCR